VVTILFTDLVDSTAIADRLGEEGAEKLRLAHFALLRAALDAHVGEEVKNLGDGLMAVFASPVDAAEAAVAMQQAIAVHNGASSGPPLSVRIGVHAGEPVREDGDYFGTPVVVASRLCAAARGGQILAGELVAALVGSRGGLRFNSLGLVELKGLSDPLPVAELVWTDDPTAAGPAGRSVPRRPRRAPVPRGPALVGRPDELARLEEEYARAVAGEFRCVVLTGEPGVGKTRLAMELMSRQEEGPALRSRSHTMTSGVAFGAWIEALDPLLQVLGDDEVAELCGGFLDDLSGLFHRVAALRGPWSRAREGQEAPRPRLFAGLTRMLDELTVQAPLVVLLDDVHWADASSWEVLRQVARRLDAAPLLVLLTARPAELAEHEAAAGVLFELEQDGLLTRLDLMPLQVAGLRALAEQVIGAEPKAALVDWLAERSLGNPLFALGLLRALLEEGADLSAPTLRRLPENLTERIAARARQIHPTQMMIFELLAVAGRPLALADLLAASELQLEELGPLLAELTSARGVIETERGRTLTYEISHPLVRDAVYEQMGGARRRAVHRHLARVLRDAGHVAEAAGHFARAADPGDPEAVSALLAALREAEEREAVVEALGVLGALVELLPRADDRWLDVLDAMRARADWITDHRADGRAEVTVAALQAIDGRLRDDHDPQRRAVVKFRLAHFLGWGIGDVAAAERLCSEARELFELIGDAQQVRVAERELAWIRGLEGDYTTMVARAKRLAEAAEAAGDIANAALAWATVAPAEIIRGRFDVGLVANERAAALAQSADKPYRFTVTQNMTAMALAARGQMTEARGIFAETKRRDPSYRDSGHLDIETWANWFAGDFGAALAAAQECARASPAGGLRRLIGMEFGALAAIERGDRAEAARQRDRARGVLGDRQWQFHQPMLWWVDAMLLWSDRELGSALAALTDAIAQMCAQDLLFIGVPALLDLVDLAAEAGDHELVSRASGQLTEVAAAAAEPFRVMAAIGASRALLVADARSDAVATATAAVTGAEGIECRALHARARYALGLACIGSDAATHLEHAARIFEGCGAVWRREKVLDALRRVGSSGRRALAAVSGPGSLTRREREVAELAAQGMSAKEIAGALFVGERTVETHLGNVYAKLGVESKLDLVRRAGELGII
jgi:class 3 adenylate cyclase/DNA-binding CsgD family transcriptional regulator/tetratricopeptide (TPR) repeat protein